ncbi:hypothetical protein HanXRQr2_Chr03g0108971 [Helianthus annuus]|uniref:Uncharacterized protein n=1 Tax=Helianthus annuus TaxID=4232 RepID=A0A9K3NWP4_HELAN|nr:hypothetical protein HanXRQr2_Chr03g0108971 [Helianthus annuus]KAJ0943506.1 hypothetical protein HanPSC8_Chr03g0105541 [Helianthus annuus]
MAEHRSGDERRSAARLCCFSPTIVIEGKREEDSEQNSQVPKPVNQSWWKKCCC